ncbi:hypothetical protein PaG_05191 [Moesziomyces aphidis]|uniref:Sld7 C-terminal domain-containing protein n=1 Tax=Moesziomyces aphidis TaxID=84754 RepID=W3VI83_MOEAP|nr:hypothetical protein PaG_05191 [Moesziomyces aphidis]
MESFASSSGGVHALSEGHHSPRRSRAKARLLWRSDLVLIDGTQLPGIAIVSYSNPFGEPVEDGNKHHGARANLHEAEADLCLALEMLRNQPLRIASVAKHRGPEPRSALPGQRQTHWVASGEVRVYIDPKESATWAFFQRIFCFEADFLTDADDERSAQVLTVSLQPSLHAPSTENGASDPFATVHTPTAPHSEFAIFAQPVRATEGVRASADAPSTSIRLVLGRRVTVQTRRPLAANSSRELSRSRSFHRQQSIGSQSLQDVFSQAGLTLPILGGLPFPSATLAPRPDDPLPRGSISALLQARSKQASGSAERSRAVSPARSPSVVPPTITGGPHTPGRRGEKRRRGSDQKVAGSPSHGADVHDEQDARNASPTKAIKRRADRILSDLPRLNLGKQPMRAPVTTPRDSSDLLDVAPAEVESASPEPFALESNEPVDKTNRNLIKKLVHTLLVREHGLSKTHPDYIATYNQTCSGTWCTFRNVANSHILSKDAVENVVRIHLSLYLYSSVE